MKKFNRDEMKEIILSTLLTMGFITIALAAPNAVQIFNYFKPKNAYERERIRNSLHRLERQSLIKQKGNLDGYFILTREGRAKAMRYKIEKTKIQRQNRWDKKWRMVMFDVPHEKRKARQAINYALKKIGCVHYQKSVFITPFPCEKEVNFIGDTFDVREHIRIVVAEIVEGDTAFKNKFGL
ncbi:MAG TPA: hypothetical protein VJH89_03425 [Patescibacteria group bacterium]|nr:hypothetical protein [Patescibacteria group bacterium]